MTNKFLTAFCIFSLINVAILSSQSKNKQNFKGYSIFHETMVDMTWQEIEKAAKEGTIILMTTAVIEEHGPHMDCGIDTYLGYNSCKLVKRELEKRGIKALIAPPFYWGINRTSHTFAGTFTVRDETMKMLLHDIFSSLKSLGFTTVFNINSHGDGQHIRVGIQSIRESRESLGMNIRYVVSEDENARYRFKGDEDFILLHKSPSFMQPPEKYLDIHAGAFETGLVATYFPNLVNSEVAKNLKPTKMTSNEIGRWLTDMKSVTPLGYVGDPANYPNVAAKKYWDESCRNIAEAIEELLKR